MGPPHGATSNHRCQEGWANTAVLPARPTCDTLVSSCRSRLATAGTSGMLRVVLESTPGNKKIHAIKVLRDATGLGNKELKDMVDGIPSVVGVFDANKARTLAREAAAIGAVVKLHPE